MTVSSDDDVLPIYEQSLHCITRYKTKKRKPNYEATLDISANQVITKGCVFNSANCAGGFFSKFRAEAGALGIEILYRVNQFGRICAIVL